MAMRPVSDEQCAEALAAYEAHGRNKTHAAASLGLDRMTFKNRLDKAIMRLEQDARRGHAPGHFDSGVAPGYVMGKVTVQRNASGDVERTWERQSPESRRAEDAVKAIFDAFAEPVADLPPIVVPTSCDDDLLTLYPMGDPHFGLHCWGKETGEDFDLAEAERVTCAAIDRLVALAPNSRHATLLNLGDFYHMDDQRNVTPQSGNQLDADTRFAKVVRVGAKAMRWCVLRLLQKHETVRVRCVRGNHDPHAALALEMALEAFFENDPRVTIDTSPTVFSFQRFGKVLLGECHGDTIKPADLPGVMMSDAREHISSTEFWHWHCGHVHHDSVKEYQGIMVETHRTLAAGDAWHKGRGYRSGRSMKAVTYHREYGEVHRSTCDVSLLRAA